MATYALTRKWLEEAMVRVEGADEVVLPGDTARALMRAAWELLVIESEDHEPAEDEPAEVLLRPPPETRH